MGILNVTPDSFADGGRHLDPATAVEAGMRMEESGADIIDVGGESTRPGAAPLDANEEMRRVLPVIEQLAGRLRVPISIDTYKAEVADAAADAGAAIVNDISGFLYEPRLAEVAARRLLPVVLMHTRGRSAEMYQGAVYTDAVDDVIEELGHRVAAATAAGIPRERIMVDPGLGFAKRPEHSFAVLAGLPRFARLDLPLVVGASRKSFLRAALGEAGPDEREWGTAAAVTAAVLFGAHVVRVHGVRQMVDVVRVADRIRS
jgi:dihydropteroate synthase